jgi:hypothetical protein
MSGKGEKQEGRMHHREAESDDWGDTVARNTFLVTLGLALLFVAAVWLFIYL